MKNNLLFYFLAMLLTCSIVACSGNAEQKSDAATTQKTATNAVAKQDPHAGHDHAGHDHGEEPKVHKASPLSPYFGMWEYNYTMKIRDKEAQQKNEGRWIKFEQDQTFTSGRWGKTLNKGTWSVTEDGSQIAIDYENHLDQVDRTWRPQGIGGDVMIWNGTKENNATGTSIKMKRIEALPQKK